MVAGEGVEHVGRAGAAAGGVEHVGRAGTAAGVVEHVGMVGAAAAGEAILCVSMSETNIGHSGS